MPRKRQSAEAIENRKRPAEVPLGRGKPEAAPKPTRKPTKLTVKADPNTDRASARRVHLEAMLGGVYATSIGSRIRKMFEGFDLSESAMLYARDMLERMAPRDPMEEMLIAQALAAHSRVMHLTSLANSQESLGNIRTVHEYADRASNTYRRLMLALAEYRKPPRAGDSFTAIKQANIAGQQVVMNSENSPRQSATNEQGFRDAPDTQERSTETSTALPADTGGTGIPPSSGGLREALGAIHGTEDTRGQGPKPDERLEAR